MFFSGLQTWPEEDLQFSEFLNGRFKIYWHIVSQIFISVEEQCTISVLNNGLLWTYYQENPSS